MGGPGIKRLAACCSVSRCGESMTPYTHPQIISVFRLLSHSQVI